MVRGVFDLFSADNVTRKTFSWFPKFLKLAICTLEIKDVKVLENLILVFLRLVSGNMQYCYRKSNSAAKLRSVTAQMLVYFNMIYRDIKLKTFTDSAYLRLMSDLMAIYVDLEIKASKHGDESLYKVGHRITTALYVFLDRSESHIAETILKAKLITKANKELCAIVLSKVLKDADCFPIHDSDFLRFLLMFKLWKKIQTDPEKRKLINEVAISKLTPPPQVVDLVMGLKGVKRVQSRVMSVLMRSRMDLTSSKREFLKSRGLRSCNESLPDGVFGLVDFFCDSFSFAEQEKRQLFSPAFTSGDNNDPENGKLKIDGDSTCIRPPAKKSEEAVLIKKSGAFEGLNTTLEVSQATDGKEPNTVQYKSVAKRFRIVKSNQLKLMQNSSEKPAKGFTFSSKLVKITKKEFTESKPRRTRDWKGKRSAQKKNLKQDSERLDSSSSNTLDYIGKTPTSLGRASSFPDPNFVVEKDFGDLFPLIYPEDDLIRCMPSNSLDYTPEDFLAPKLISDGNNSFDFHDDGLFLVSSEGEGHPQSVTNREGTVFEFLRRQELRGSCHDSDSHCRSYVYAVSKRRAKILSDSDRLKPKEKLVEETRTLPLKKRPTAIQFCPHVGN